MTVRLEDITPEVQNAAAQLYQLLKALDRVMSDCGLEADERDALGSVIEVMQEKARLVHNAISP